MLKAIKNNKVYKIDEAQKAGYLTEGFDIYKDGRLIEKSPVATVPYEEYRRLKEEVEALRTEKGGGTNGDVASILIAYAKEHNIDVGQAKSIDGIVKKIRGHNPEGGE